MRKLDGMRQEHKAIEGYSFLKFTHSSLLEVYNKTPLNPDLFHLLHEHSYLKSKIKKLKIRRNEK